MPVHDSLTENDVANEAELRGLLEQELTKPNAVGEPVIVIERPHAATIHLFVIWSRFEGLEQIVRSRIVLDAFEAVKGKAESLKVTVSMGLTPDEAKRTGLKI